MLFCTLSYFQFGRSHKTGFPSATHPSLPSRRLSKLSGALRARSLLNVSPAGAPQYPPTWRSGMVGHLALCNGFSTRSSEYDSSLSVSNICVIRCPLQPHAASFHRALYCVTSAALLPPARRPSVIFRVGFGRQKCRDGLFA